MPSSQPPSALSHADLTHLDGLRGALALLVVTAHTALYTGLEGELYRVPALVAIRALAEFAVPVFIVLSGFTLMIAIARRDVLTLRGGVLGHFRRRARRLLPPYFAALAVSIALIAAVPVLNTTHGTQWDRKIPMTIDAVVSHVFLVHNLRPDLINAINGSLWSIAVEWQITLAMPLLLLLWRRTNAGLVVAATTAIGLASTATGILAWSAPFFPLLFALGMLAAHWTQGRPEALERRRGRAVRWVLRRDRSATVITASALVAVVIASVVWHVPFATTVVGVLSAAVLALDQERARVGRRASVAVRFLRLAPLRGLGNASYSIYLLHAPLLALGNLLLLPLALPTVPRFLLLLVTVAPLTMACCGVLYWTVERRFMNSHQRSVVQTSAARHRSPRTGSSRSRRWWRAATFRRHAAVTSVEDQPPTG